MRELITGMVEVIEAIIAVGVIVTIPVLIMEQKSKETLNKK